MKTFFVGFSVLAVSTLALGSCSSDDDNDDPMPNGGSGGMAGGMAMAGGAGDGGTGGMPMTSAGALNGVLGRANPPVLGDRIDRAGRVAVTAALIGAFNPDANTAVALRDAYNEGPQLDPANTPELMRSLAILDGLDENCGNQAAADAAGDRYSALAGILGDDQLYLDSDVPNCPDAYLGLELGRPGQCGGRNPGEDVIEVSYSVLAAGLLAGVDDLVGADDAVHDLDVFPFIAAPL